VGAVGDDGGEEGGEEQEKEGEAHGVKLQRWVGECENWARPPHGDAPSP
jgi:hypothetical protein